MKVVVLGAGVIGTTSAWYLARTGHEVMVVDRQPEVALETSFANGGQISVSHCEPWANPAAPSKILQWLGREDAPLLFRPRADLAQWLWSLRFLFECLPGRTRRNTAAAFALALYSQEQLRELRRDTGIRYDSQTRGILHLYEEPREFERAKKQAELLRARGLETEIKTPLERRLDRQDHRRRLCGIGRVRRRAGLHPQPRRALPQPGCELPFQSQREAPGSRARGDRARGDRRRRGNRGVAARRRLCRRVGKLQHAVAPADRHLGAGVSGQRLFDHPAA